MATQERDVTPVDTMCVLCGKGLAYGDALEVLLPDGDVEPNGEWRPLARVSPRRRLEAVALLHVLVAEAGKRDDARRRPVEAEEIAAGVATLRALRGEP